MQIRAVRTTRPVPDRDKKSDRTASRGTRIPRRVRAAAVLTASTIGASMLGVLALAPSAYAADPYCGPSTYVQQIEVEPWADGHQKIKVYPSAASRTNPDPRAVTNDMWHAVQACVSGLYDTRADTVYDQLECHQHLALLKRYRGESAGEFYTGPTYDLETWRPTFHSDHVTWGWEECGNKLGTNPPGPIGPAERPDARKGDFGPGFNSNVA